MTSRRPKKPKGRTPAPAAKNAKSQRRPAVSPRTTTNALSPEDRVLSLAKTLSSNWNAPAERVEALVALNKLNWQATRALPAIVAALDDPDEHVRLKAFRLVNKLGRGILEDAALISSTRRQEPQERLAAIRRIFTISPEIREAIDAHELG
jgi:hypothetical protein